MTSLTREGHPHLLPVVAGQVRYTLTEYWRARIVLVMSLLIPLLWLFIIGAVAGNEVLDPGTGLRVMQFATPLAVTMGALYGAMPAVAVTIAQARETGLLKRLRGTPLPGWAYLTGRAVGAAAFALVAVVAALAVAVLAYDVQLVRRTALSTTVTLTLAVVCFVALGLAISALSPSSTVAQAVSIGGVVVLSFISGLFTFGGELPAAVTRVADLLPVKPLAEALQDQFNPYLTGSGWDLRTVAVLLAWTVAAGAVAARGWGRRDPAVTSRRGRAPGLAASAQAAPRTVPAGQVLSLPGRPRTVALVTAQAVAALRTLWRDPGAVFFAVVLPLGLFALVATTTDSATLAGDVPFTVHLAAGMATWGLAVTAFMNIPESVVQARDRGVLKRLGGTPLPPAHYLAGRILAAVVLGVLVCALVVALAVVGYDAPVSLPRLARGLALVALGSVVLVACGFLLAAVVPNARTFGAVGLVVLLPVAFVSDIFVVGGPTWMATVGALFPLRHLQNALTDVLAGVGGGDTWWHVAVLAAWGAGAALLALRFFRWTTSEP